MPETHYYFKLDPNIRNPTEVLFGRMEIEGLLKQKVAPIRHFYDVLKQPPLSYFDNGMIRIQDFLLNLRTAYGGVQGYYFSAGELLDLGKLVERLGYTREIYVCFELADALEETKRKVFPYGVDGKNLQVWTISHAKSSYCLFRVITNIFFLEQLNNVILCSSGKTRTRQVDRMDDNISRLTRHVMENVRTYIPKFPKDSNWKEFEDFVDEPKEITLYLTHRYGPPYKAKFHPRMIRALINFANAGETEVTGDFMLGSGTLAIESALLNVKTVGSDINPLTEIVARAKVEALSLGHQGLLQEIDNVMAALPGVVSSPERNPSPFAARFFKGKEKFRDQALSLSKFIRAFVEEKYKNFFLCALAKVCSLADKKKNESDVFQLFEAEVWNMWKVVYCFSEARKFLHVDMGVASIGADDIKSLSSVNDDSIDLIVTSPPYSTAIDYVKMDLAQLLLLELIKDPKDLDKNMIGTRRKTSDIDQLSLHISDSKPLVLDSGNRFFRLPCEARKYILDLKSDGNTKMTGSSASTPST